MSEQNSKGSFSRKHERPFEWFSIVKLAIDFTSDKHGDIKVAMIEAEISFTAKTAVPPTRSSLF
jgi:hypothetical protein